MMDRTDEDILYYLQNGRTNAYQVWTSMDKESNEHTMAYNNVWKRFNHLSDAGIIQRINVTQITVHARKDYEISKKGKQAIQEHIRKLEQILK